MRPVQGSLRPMRRMQRIHMVGFGEKGEIILNPQIRDNPSPDPLKQAVGRHYHQRNDEKGDGPQKAGAHKAPAPNVYLSLHCKITPARFFNTVFTLTAENGVLAYRSIGF